MCANSATLVCTDYATIITTNIAAKFYAYHASQRAANKPTNN
jgi:hypothetical protein